MIKSETHITRLTQDVINRIAAGEVVQRPFAALKEMMENSIDAGATKIQILCQDGGLSVLQIADDGSGIFKEDLPMLCERFATSKLRTFDDLSHVSSFGFRGEALASISHVSRVTVTTMRREDPYAWQAQFLDGKMIRGPQPHAGNPGTVIRVEDMFYNAPVRRSSLGKPSEEYSRIIDLVQKYSICFPSIAFSCRSMTSGIQASTGSVKFDYTTQSNSSVIANLKNIYGSSLVSHLLSIEASSTVSGGGGGGGVHANAHGDAPNDCVTIKGYISDQTLSNKRSIFVLFVNQRLVDSAALRRCSEHLYASIYVGGNKSVIFLDVRVPPHRVDVNIHPTKHEVMLLDEDLVLRTFAEVAKTALAKSSALKQLHVGQVDHQILNLKPVSHSSTSVNVAGHKGVVVAPCTVTRVIEQRGDMMKYVTKVDPFALVEKDVQTRKSTSSSSSILKGENDDLADRGGGESCDDSFHRSSNSDVSASSPQLLDGGAVVHVSSSAMVDDEVPVTAVTPAAAESSKAQQSFYVDLDSEEVEDENDDDLQREFKRHRAEVNVTMQKEHAEAASLAQCRCAAEHVAPATAAMSDSPQTVAVPSASSLDTICSSSSSQPPLTTLGPLATTGTSTQPPPVTECLTSVQTLLKSFASESSSEMEHMFEKLVFVGNIDDKFFFAQSGTTLFVVKTLQLAKRVAFQRIFRSFGCHQQVSFVDGTAPSVAALLRFAIEHDVPAEEKQNVIGDGDVETAIARSLKTLRRWRHMLDEYFCIDIRPIDPESKSNHRSPSLTIRKDLTLFKLPMLLGDAWPCAHRSVPMLLWRLATRVDYCNEERCLVQIATAIAEEMYGRGIKAVTKQQTSSPPTSSVVTTTADSSSMLYDAVRFGLIPVATKKSKFYPSVELLSDHTLRSIVTVEALYKVFERC